MSGDSGSSKSNGDHIYRVPNLFSQDRHIQNIISNANALVPDHKFGWPRFSLIGNGEGEGEGEGEGTNASQNIDNPASHVGTCNEQLDDFGEHSSHAQDVRNLTNKEIANFWGYPRHPLTPTPPALERRVFRFPAAASRPCGNLVCSGTPVTTLDPSLPATRSVGLHSSLAIRLTTASSNQIL